MNRLSRYCDGLIEAAWLLAAIMVPLYFFLGSLEPFGFGKIAFFRTLVLIGAAAWLMKVVSAGRGSASEAWGRMTAQPLALWAAALAGVYGISTAFSILPLVSLRGMYLRYDGLFTLLIYILFFALVASNLRTRPQVERLIATLAAVSFAVDFYALLQHFGLDAIPWTQFNVTERAFSTIGHPIFMTAFLGMTLMLMLGRLVHLFSPRQGSDPAQRAGIVLAVLYSMISVLNLLAIWYGSSRGPLIALFVGLIFFGLCFLTYYRLRRTFYVFSAAGLLVLLFVGVLNMSNGPLSGLRDKPVTGPLGHIFDAGSGTGRTRVLIWNGMLRLILPHPPIRIPGVEQGDRWNFIRPLVGYGPDTISLVYEDFYLPEQFSLESYDLFYDHAHNEFWDVLALYGLAGLVVEYGFFLSLIYFGLKWLGWIPSKREGSRYWWMSLLGGALGGLTAFLVLGAEYLGLGIPFGLLLGAGYTLLARMFVQKDEHAANPGLWRDMLLISALSLIVFHYVEVLFGISVIFTRILFWIACSLLLTAGQGLIAGPRPGIGLERIRRIGITVGVAVTIASALAPGFLSNLQGGTNGTLQTWINSISVNSYSILWMLLGGILVSCLLLELGSADDPDVRGFIPRLMIVTGAAIVVSFLVWILYAGRVASISQINYLDAEKLLSGYTGLVNIQFAALIIFAYLMAFLLMEPEGRRMPLPSPLVLGGFGLLQVSLAALVIFVNLVSMQANAAMKVFNNYLNTGQYQAAFVVSDRLLELEPLQYAFFFNTGEAYMNYAIARATGSNLAGYLAASEKDYLQAYKMNPLDFRNLFGLAHINRLWAKSLSQNPAAQKERLAQAERYYASALDGRPYRVKLWVDWADFHLETGDLQGARQKVDAALKIDDTYAPAYLLSANVYLTGAQKQTDPSRRTELLDLAAKDVATAIEMLARRGGNPSPAYLQLGNIQSAQGRYEQARDSYLQAGQLGAGSSLWEVYRNLAEVSGRLNDAPSRRTFLEKAIRVAPALEVPGLQAQLDALTP